MAIFHAITDSFRFGGVYAIPWGEVTVKWETGVGFNGYPEIYPKMEGMVEINLTAFGGKNERHQIFSVPRGRSTSPVADAASTFLTALRELSFDTLDSYSLPKEVDDEAVAALDASIREVENWLNKTAFKQIR